MNIDKRALKGVVDEIEASRARQKGETEFQREALKRAVKNHQLDAKAIRIVLQRRAMGETKRDEQDYYVHSYELALGGKKDALEALERGASIREAAKAGGISTGSAASLAKGVQESSFVNGETGEITTAGLDTPPVGSGDLIEGHSSAAPGSDPVMRAVIRDTLKAMEKAAVPELSPGTGSATVVATGNLDALSPILTSPEKLQHAPCITDEAGAVAEAQPERVARQDDGLDIPPFLRRQRASA